MRVAAIYDIHGNLPALEAVLREIRQAGVDQIIVGGDLVPGPMPRETFSTLMNLDIPVQCIQGNCEREVLALASGAEVANLPAQFLPAFRWCAEQLQPDYIDVVANWPKTVRVRIDGLGDVLFCHAMPRDDNEIFTRLTPEDRLLPIMDAAGADIVVCGHTHMQFDRTVGKVRVVNAGSVGSPFGEPGAYWLLLGPAVQFQNTAYDLAEAASRIRATAYPLADDFAETNVLTRRSEAEMVERYERAALK